jgi:hypothetical protein
VAVVIHGLNTENILQVHAISQILKWVKIEYY